MTHDDLDFGREVLRQEAKAVEALAGRLDASFREAVELLFSCRGKVILSGVGKAGVIARKIAATLSSTGTPAHFLHPTDAQHGDLGVVAPGDVAILLSNSGQTAEVVALVHHLKNVGAKLVVVSGNPQAPICQPNTCDVFLDMGVIEEACPLGLAPSCSTTVMLALGDALALTVLRRRGFTGEDYIRFHPAGDLGRRLLRVEEVMRTGERLPLVQPDTPVGEVIGTISRARAGAAPVVDAEGKLVGIFTDGDFRRLWMKASEGGRNAAASGEVMLNPVSRFMTSPCISIGGESVVGEAMGILRGRHVNELPVVDKEERVIGILDVQDIVGIDV